MAKKGKQHSRNKSERKTLNVGVNPKKNVARKSTLEVSILSGTWSDVLRQIQLSIKRILAYRVVLANSLVILIFKLVLKLRAF